MICACRVLFVTIRVCFLTPMQDLGPLSASLPPKKFFGRFACTHAFAAPGVLFLLQELLRHCVSISLISFPRSFDPEFLEERRKGLDSCVHACRFPRSGAALLNLLQIPEADVGAVEFCAADHAVQVFAN